MGSFLQESMHSSDTWGCKMRKTLLALVAMLLILTFALASGWAQPSANRTWSLRPVDWNKNRWELSVGTLFTQPWGENLGRSYLRMTVGLVATLKNQYLQEPGLFAQLAFGWEWSLHVPLPFQLSLSGFSHEISLKLKDLNGQPAWVVEFLPLVVAFDIDNLFIPAKRGNDLSFPFSTLSIPSRVAAEGQSRAESPQQVQQTTVDLKALVLARLDDLLKASEQLSKEKPVITPDTFVTPLNEAKKAFEAGKIPDMIVQLNSYSMVLRAIRKFLPDTMTEFDESYLRSGFHRLADALALYTERIQQKPTRICTGLYIDPNRKEEVIGQFLNEAPKTASFGTKGTLTLKESKCF